MSIDAMKLALEALEAIHRTGDTQAFDLCYADKVIPSLRAAIEQSEKRWVKSYAGGKPNYTTPEEQTRQWQGLSFFDKTLLRTTHAPLKPVYHDRVHDRSVCAEVVTDWDKFFKAIESKLREKNT